MCGVSGRDDCAIKIRHLHGSTDISNTHRCAERAILRTEGEIFAVGAQIGRFCARMWRGVEGSGGVCPKSASSAASTPARVAQKADCTLKSGLFGQPGGGSGGEWRKWRKGRDEEGFAALRAPRPSVSGSKAIRDEPGRLFLRFCAQGLMKASFQRRCAQNAKTLHLRAASELLCIARRGRDSNPRNLSVQQFSRLP